MPDASFRRPQGVVPRKRAARRLRWLERSLLTIGCVVSLFVLAAYVHRAVMFHSAMKAFEQARQDAINHPEPAGLPERAEAKEDLVSSRIPSARTDSGVKSAAAVNQRHTLVTSAPLAILRVPRIRLEAPVLGATDDITLNRGVGQIAGTAMPGENGNIVVLIRRQPQSTVGGFDRVRLALIYRSLRGLRGDECQVLVAAGPDVV